MSVKVNVNDLVLVQGMKDTKLTLARWNQAPFKAVGPWALLSLAVALSLLASVYGVCQALDPGRRPVRRAGPDRARGASATGSTS